MVNMKMVAAGFYEAFVIIYGTVWRRILENNNIHISDYYSFVSVSCLDVPLFPLPPYSL
jgi:hypothetical protein